ncbi:DUF6776 family protein [Novilysobacter antarcticus]|uniref:DUF6776 family protein n=1 Tax=Novilysobacter antarcticus TaxID=2862543 RepID=UPI001C99C7AD|nr:DUF6776 family protein [Lysobacter antarcticus]
MPAPEPEPVREPNPERKPVWAARRAPSPMVLWVAVAVAVLFGGWGMWRTLGGGGDVHARLSASEQANDELQARLDEMQQNVATLTRSDQISRDANRDLQGALAEREEEIAGLRADVAFYERLVGATSQRRGLTVHALRMSPQNDNAWEFQTTLTQNLNRGAVSSGRLSLAIEGTLDGKREELVWSDLRQGDDADGTPFSFKYFQQIKGDVFLPDGFSPVRVTVKLQPRSGSPITESFNWSEVIGNGPQGGVAPAEAD